MLESVLPARASVRRVCVWSPVLAVLIVGCGGVSTYRVSGKVTFKGQPVPAGKIYFMPDGSKGNTGPTGYADISNGSYDTSGGAGAPAGAVTVAIEGFDPNQAGVPEKGDTSGEVLKKSLFPRYETKLDVAGNLTKDFEVPADAAKAKPAGEKQFVQP